MNADFSKALTWLKQHKRVRRRAWPSGSFILLDSLGDKGLGLPLKALFGKSTKIELGSEHEEEYAVIGPCITMVYEEKGSWRLWVNCIPQLDDLLAEDWELVDEPAPAEQDTHAQTKSTATTVLPPVSRLVPTYYMQSKSRKFLDLVDYVIFNPELIKIKIWQGTSEELYWKLWKTSSRFELDKLAHTGNAVGKLLSVLEYLVPGRVTAVRTATERRWLVYPPTVNHNHTCPA